MRIKMRTLIVISVAILGVLLTGSYLIPNQDDLRVRQVIKVAATNDSNYLLPFEKHIRFTPRPKESFTFPIPLGEVGPIDSLYAGRTQYPFFCMAVESDLGQPLVDNLQGYGVPIYQSLNNKNTIIGYSKNCSVKSQLMYFSIADDHSLTKLTSTSNIPTDIKMLLRVEQGTINRFIYTIVMPITADEMGVREAKSQWNQRLIYQFNGGSGIGYRQGKQSAKRVIKRQLQQLLDGYAVISSSGNKTSYTYNMLLAEDTARRVKTQFISLYGEPLYTVGVGGSGGGLAQYLIAQNSQGILDGLIPQYSYPDMITTTTYALDCDLLNNYYTFRAKNKHRWQNWDKRQLIEGLNSKNDFPQRAGFLQPVNQLMAGFVPSFPDGNSECINGYFGLSSFINNPKQGFIRQYFNDHVVENTKWSYWQDMAHILGTDLQGYGLSTWDNVGVQYGLNALTRKQITLAEFIDINKKIGGWKAQPQMVKEKLFTPFGKRIPIWLSLWGNENITEINHGIAPRQQGSITAMHNAYRSGQVFIGKTHLPIIDVRHYLEDDLDMHHVSASFYSRLRLIEANGHAENQVIWVVEKGYDITPLVFKTLDIWLLKLKQLKNHSNIDDATLVLASKPQGLNDACFDDNGELIDKGEDTWHDEWALSGKNITFNTGNKIEKGTCAKRFPIYTNSRIQAGGSWQSSTFKCQLMPVDDAINKQMYGDIDVTEYTEVLKQIFPQGVCDHHKPDLGRPQNL